MTTEDQRAADVVAGVPLGRVFVSYAHDLEGRRLAAALRRALQDSGCDVRSDHDMPTDNPTSMQLWMDREIAGRTVLCVLSAEYGQAFDEPDTATPPHMGVRYEIRAILQKIYHHVGSSRCPVIPVASPRFVAEEAPAQLRSLVVARFDPDTGEGADRIVARIAALAGAGADGAMSVGRRRRPDRGRAFRQVLHELGSKDEESAEAIGLVREGIELVEGLAQPAELLNAFPQLEKVIKAHGDGRLMETLSDECLLILRSRSFLFPQETTLEADVLIFGKGWHLTREYRLQDALGETLKGIRLAEKDHNRKTAAYGRICTGRIRMLLAEQSSGPDCEYQLRASSLCFAEAMKLFTAIDEDGANCSAVGTCLSQSARAEMLRYRLYGDKSFLDAAAKLTDQADDVLSYDQARDYDLAVLRSEIASARRRWAEARRLLDQVIETLEPKAGAEYREILAQAYQARAVLASSSRGSRDSVMRDLEQAREIFRCQRLGYGVAACEWDMLKIDSASVTPIKITRPDVLHLEDLSGDPRTRLLAIAELKRRMDGRIGPRPSVRQINWEALVNRVRLPI